MVYSITSRKHYVLVTIYGKPIKRDSVVFGTLVPNIGYMKAREEAEVLGCGSAVVGAGQ